MNLQELKEYLYKYGITLDECYYEEDRRKRWYAIDYPVFSGEKGWLYDGNGRPENCPLFEVKGGVE